LPILNQPFQRGGIEGKGHLAAKIKVAKALSAAGYTVKYEEDFFIDKYTFHCDIYLPLHDIIVEVDGTTHDSRRAKSKDAWKDEHLKSEGHRVMRMTIDEAMDMPEQILPRVHIVASVATTYKPRAELFEWD